MNVYQVFHTNNILYITAKKWLNNHTSSVNVTLAVWARHKGAFTGDTSVGTSSD